MARTALTVTTLTKNTAVATGTGIGTAIDATNSHVLTVAYPLDALLVRIVNTTASTKVATIKAGDNPPATAAGQGDLAVSLTAGDSTPTVKTVVLESARFIQDDGTLNIDIEAGMTGFIAVLRVPRG
jgi:hypothetical protein